MTLVDVITISIFAVMFTGGIGALLWAFWATYKMERKMGYFMGVRVWQGEDNPTPFKGGE